jgi:hypothetical protein
VLDDTRELSDINQFYQLDLSDNQHYKVHMSDDIDYAACMRTNGNREIWR